MVCIENKRFIVSINLHGGSLSSIYDKKSSEELMYQKDSRSWSGQDVVIFPFIGAIRDRKYTYNNKEYTERNHGLLRYMDCKVFEQKEDEITLFFESNSDTLKEYPFLFKFYITYSLKVDTLKISYKVENKDLDTLLFNLGGHPAIKASGFEDINSFNLENTRLVFDENFETILYNLNEDGSLIEKESLVKVPKEIDLSKEYIESLKTFMIDVKDINKVTLYTNCHEFIYDIRDFTTLAVWTTPGFGNFICVEPWIGHPDYTNSSSNLCEKKYLKKLESGKTFSKSFTITIH